MYSDHLKSICVLVVSIWNYNLSTKNWLKTGDVETKLDDWKLYRSGFLTAHSAHLKIICALLVSFEIWERLWRRTQDWVQIQSEGLLPLSRFPNIFDSNWKMYLSQISNCICLKIELKFKVRACCCCPTSERNSALMEAGFAKFPDIFVYDCKCICVKLWIVFVSRLSSNSKRDLAATIPHLSATMLFGFAKLI